MKRRELNDLIIVPGHDHTDYQFRFLEPDLSKGGFTHEERQEIKKYEEQLFDESGRLRSSAMPHFIPPAHGERVGKAA